MAQHPVLHTSSYIFTGENIIAMAPGADTTLGQHIDTLFRYYVLPYFSSSTAVCLMFDDSEGKGLKMTCGKRYGSENHPNMSLRMESVVTKDWKAIFMHPKNKLQLKRLFVTRILETIRFQFEDGHKLYLNGSDNTGLVNIVTKNEVQEDEYVLPIGESDVKIFALIDNMVEENFSNFLVISTDSDVKMLSVVFQAKYRNIQLVVKSFNQVLPYFYPNCVINYFEENFSSNSPVLVHAKNMLRVYLIFGADQTPGFYGLCHSAGLMVFDATSRQKALTEENDFLELIVDTYVFKNSGVKRFMIDSSSLEEKHASTREIVKCLKGLESNTVPIMSVLKLHLKRSQFLQISWLNPSEAENLDPCKHGYTLDKHGIICVDLQDKNDPFYSLPQSLLKARI